MACRSMVRMPWANFVGITVMNGRVRTTFGTQIRKTGAERNSELESRRPQRELPVRPVAISQQGVRCFRRYLRIFRRIFEHEISRFSRVESTPEENRSRLVRVDSRGFIKHVRKCLDHRVLDVVKPGRVWTGSNLGEVTKTSEYCVAVPLPYRLIIDRK